MRFDPFKLADCLIERKYEIPVFEESVIGIDSSDSSFMTARNKTVNLGEYLSFMRSYVETLKRDIELYSEYHKIAHEYRNTSPRSEYQEGCRDTFGAGFFLEHDEYKEIREHYWKIQAIKENK